MLANDTSVVFFSVNNDLQQINFVPKLAFFIRSDIPLLAKTRLQFTGG